MASNRWVEGFENHEFWENWNRLLRFVNEGIDEKELDTTIPSNVQEMARAVKAITYINELIKSCDPELVPMATWDNFNAQIHDCLQRFQQYEMTGNIDYLRKANSNIDHLLSYIRPYIQIRGEAATSMNTALRAYQNTINETLAGSLKNVDHLNKYLEERKIDADASLTQIEESKTYISDYEHELLDSEDNLRDKISVLVNNLENSNHKIEAYKEELLTEFGGNRSIQQKIHYLRMGAEEHEVFIRGIREKIIEETQFLYDVYKKVHGTEQEDGTVEGGLLNEITDRQEGLDQVKEQHEDVYKTILEQIKELLHGATNASLASAYQELKIGCEQPIKNYNYLFYGAMGMLFFSGFVLMTKSFTFSPFSISFVEIAADWASIMKNLLRELPIILPVVWLAVFATKRRNEFSRLREEYAHKEALAKSYEGFKSQIKKIPDEDDKLLKELLTATIKAVSFNASTTLDKKHDDGTPVKNLIDGILKLKKADLLKLDDKK